MKKDNITTKERSHTIERVNIKPEYNTQHKLLEIAKPCQSQCEKLYHQKRPIIRKEPQASEVIPNVTIILEVTKPSLPPRSA